MNDRVGIQEMGTISSDRVVTPSPKELSEAARRPDLAPVLLLSATVFFVRSWDSNVYLTGIISYPAAQAGQPIKGFADFSNPQAFAMAAAAQATGATIYVSAGSWDPQWGGGAGAISNVSQVSFLPLQ